MPDIGDRIMVVAGKGAPGRRGEVVGKQGSMLTVQWVDGTRSSFYPAPGSVHVEGHGSPRPSASSPRPSAKRAAASRR